MFDCPSLAIFDGEDLPEKKESSDDDTLPTIVALGSIKESQLEKLSFFGSAIGVLVLTGTDNIGPADTLAALGAELEAAPSDLAFLRVYLPGVEAVKNKGFAQNLGPDLFGLGQTEEESERFLLLLGDDFFGDFFEGNFKCFFGVTVIQKS